MAGIDPSQEDLDESTKSDATLKSVPFTVINARTKPIAATPSGSTNTRDSQKLDDEIDKFLSIIPANDVDDDDDEDTDCITFTATTKRIVPLSSSEVSSQTIRK